MSRLFFRSRFAIGADCFAGFTIAAIAVASATTTTATALFALFSRSIVAVDCSLDLLALGPRRFCCYQRCSDRCRPLGNDQLFLCRYVFAFLTLTLLTLGIVPLTARFSTLAWLTGRTGRAR